MSGTAPPEGMVAFPCELVQRLAGVATHADKCLRSAENTQGAITRAIWAVADVVLLSTEMLEHCVREVGTEVELTVSVCHPTHGEMVQKRTVRVLEPETDDIQEQLYQMAEQIVSDINGS